MQHYNLLNISKELMSAPIGDLIDLYYEVSEYCSSMPTLHTAALKALREREQEVEDWIGIKTEKNKYAEEVAASKERIEYLKNYRKKLQFFVLVKPLWEDYLIFTIVRGEENLSKKYKNGFREAEPGELALFNSRKDITKYFLKVR